MAEQPLFQFRLFFRDTPALFGGWHTYDEERRWDRHYLLGDGLSLRIVRGERVELTRLSMSGMFAVEATVMSSAFPLDWMSLSVISRSLPDALRLAEIDGRDPQRFVDSLALPGLVQASVLKHERYLREGAVIATSSHLEIPDWRAHAISVNLSCHHAQSLRLALAAIGMDRYRHMPFDDWLSSAHAAAFPFTSFSEDVTQKAAPRTMDPCAASPSTSQAAATLTPLPSAPLPGRSEKAA